MIKHGNGRPWSWAMKCRGAILQNMVHHGLRAIVVHVILCKTMVHHGNSWSNWPSAGLLHFLILLESKIPWPFGILKDPKQNSMTFKKMNVQIPWLSRTCMNPISRPPWTRMLGPCFAPHGTHASAPSYSSAAWLLVALYVWSVQSHRHLSHASIDSSADLLPV